MQPKISGDEFSFSFFAEAGKRYVTESEDLLNTSSWTPVQTNTGTGTIITITNNLPTTASERFYRINIQ